MAATAPASNPRAFVPRDPRAIAAGKKSGEVRRARREAEATAEAEAEQLKERFLSLDLARDSLAPAARACAALIIQRVALDLVRVRNGDEAAKLIGQLVEVARLEEGKHTRATVTVHATDDEVRARILAARKAIDVPAVAVSSETETPPALSRGDDEAPRANRAEPAHEAPAGVGRGGAPPP